MPRTPTPASTPSTRRSSSPAAPTVPTSPRSTSAAGLTALADQPVNILLVAGVGSRRRARRRCRPPRADREREQRADRDPGCVRVGHAERRLRGARRGRARSRDDRIVLVAPGLLATDARSGQEVALPPPYLAAAVAGMLSTLAPQISLTNKTVPIDGLDVAYSATTYKNLLQNRVLLVRQKLGFQVVKGITTDAGRVQARSACGGSSTTPRPASARARTRTSAASTTPGCAPRSRRPSTASCRRWCSTRCSSATSST